MLFDYYRRIVEKAKPIRSRGKERKRKEKSVPTWTRRLLGKKRRPLEEIKGRRRENGDGMIEREWDDA